MELQELCILVLEHCSIAAPFPLTAHCWVLTAGLKMGQSVSVKKTNAFPQSSVICFSLLMLGSLLKMSVFSNWSTLIHLPKPSLSAPSLFPGISNHIGDTYSS